jgi:hypothetical protein
MRCADSDMVLHGIDLEEVITFLCGSFKVFNPWNHTGKTATLRFKDSLYHISEEVDSGRKPSCPLLPE